MLQLQCIWTHSKRLQKAKEGTRYKKMLYIQQHIAKYYRLQQKMKNKSVQKESNEESDNNQKDFVRDLEQA